MIKATIFRTAGLTLLLSPLMSSMSVLAQYDDLLGGDDFGFDSSQIEEKSKHWTDGFKVTLDHSHTHVPHDTNREQSSVRLEYENNIADGWFLRLDTRYRYFWEEDDLAENRRRDQGREGAYGRNKWQRAWLQYSSGACTVKAGRQVLIWGDVEGTFATDIVTPFDYTEQLLTDYGNVRLAQDMAVGECFVSKSQFQVFYTPEAQTDVFQHYPLRASIDPDLAPVNLEADAEEEWGARYKWSGSRLDISLMYAKLYDNTPTVQVDYQPPEGDPINNTVLPLLVGAGLLSGTGELPPGLTIRPTLAQFNFVGLSTSIAIGRLLLEAELGYRDKQFVQFSTEETERYDAVLGFEYTTSGNHILNGGLWGTKFTNDNIEEQDVEIVTLGWRKTYRNDNLVFSLLGNWASSPEFGSVTVLSEYQWNDYLNTSLALGWADLGDLEGVIPSIPAEKSATFTIKLEF